VKIQAVSLAATLLATQIGCAEDSTPETLSVDNFTCLMVKPMGYPRKEENTRPGFKKFTFGDSLNFSKQHSMLEVDLSVLAGMPEARTYVDAVQMPTSRFREYTDSPRSTMTINGTKFLTRSILGTLKNGWQAGEFVYVSTSPGRFVLITGLAQGEHGFSDLELLKKSALTFRVK